MPRPPASPTPPPTSFPFTAGNFDYPHASTSPSSSSRLRTSEFIRRAPPSLSHRPDQDSSDHHVAPARRPPPRRLLQSGRRGTMHRLFGPPRDSDPPDNLSRRPTTANPNRPRATPSERYLRRSSARIREARADMESAADLLDSLSDIPLNNPFTFHNTNARARSPIVEVAADRRQTKRRKLDHNAGLKSEYDGFKYGYKGQVVPGRLKMEILSCDGGEYFDKDHPIGLHNVRNVLKNDSSVYCSESSRCNLLLKHIGDAPFTLEKIVIRAPDRGFTAPVQEGLIFVSMSADELLSSTAGYDLQYSARSPVMSATPTSSADDEDISLREAIEDPHVWQHSRRGAQEEMEERIENLRLRTSRTSRQSWIPPRSDRRHTQRQQEDDVYGDNCDHIADDSRSGIIRLSAPTPPPFTVTAASEAEESDSNEETPSAAVMADLMRRETLWRAETDDDDDEITSRFGGLRRAPPLDYTTYSEWRARRERHIEPIRATRVGAPSRIELSQPLPEDDNLIPPHARFFIAKNKSKITIRFHPAISGRNILLKLWSPTHDGNIDIESVQFYGYSGPRFFPAIQLC
ncbi:hypothetical protein HBI81_061950 [Parastagonospora nodorum]|nr:hypothetical protein HBH52_121240 [Parastagonospora nodorum]KAH4036741.1 hypothetical protein HBI09_076790 [Parastagonospora nodorum]KAH4051853.1 hypothetical protein HBH49_108830 [Parastagonospora nodorum]KAH4068282.1 hypothetical protein HBH50_124920 [Parastagonospora nodorum]KAH4085482.1 hypothetical protein HBH48_150230 [Parastagonospora nodorum]